MSKKKRPADETTVQSTLVDSRGKTPSKAQREEVSGHSTESDSRDKKTSESKKPAKESGSSSKSATTAKKSGKRQNETGMAPRGVSRPKRVQSPKEPPAARKQEKPMPSKAKTETPPPEDPLMRQLPGVGDRLRERLVSSGYTTVEQISRARPEALSRRVEGISVEGARRIISSAREMLQGAVESEDAGGAADQLASLESIRGVGPKLAIRLASAGYDSAERLSRARPQGLAQAIDGLSVQKAAEIVDAAKKIIQQRELQRVTESSPSEVTESRPTPEKKTTKRPEKTEEPPMEKTGKETTTQQTTAPTPVRKVRFAETKKKSADRKKPRRYKSNLPVPQPVLDLAAKMKEQWARAEEQSQKSQTVATYEVVNLGRDETIDRLVDVAVEILNESMTTGRPAFEIPSRSSDNIVWDEVRDLLLLGLKTISRPYHSLASVVDATRTARVMEIVFDLLRAGLHATKREVYYSDVNLFRDQKYSDKIIEDVASMLQTTRDSIHVVAAARGSAMGRVVIRDAGDLIDLTKMGTGGWAITPFLDQVEIVESDAEFIILSEKDAAVMRLAEARYWNRQPCIVITGKGSGDMATRAFLKRLVKELEIPAFALVDSDPYGHYIYSVFLRGSKRLSYESPFIATPELKLLGVLSRDLDEYNVPKAVRIPMEPADIKRVKDMLKEPFVASNRRWVEDLELMLKIKEKAEIQAFASHSFEYLTDEYIPRKLETGDWI